MLRNPAPTNSHIPRHPSGVSCKRPARDARPARQSSNIKAATNPATGSALLESRDRSTRLPVQNKLMIRKRRQLEEDNALMLEVVGQLISDCRRQVSGRER